MFLSCLTVSTMKATSLNIALSTWPGMKPKKPWYVGKTSVNRKKKGNQSKFLDFGFGTVSRFSEHLILTFRPNLQEHKKRGYQARNHSEPVFSVSAQLVGEWSSMFQV